MKHEHPKKVGEVSEAIVLARLIQYGYSVSLPFGDNQRYDMIVDDGERLHRIQVKTANPRRSAGSIVFNTSSTHPISGKKTQYHGQIEAFIAYHLASDGVFWVPVEDCQGDRMTLRLNPAKNNQQDGIRMADQYRLLPRN